MDVLLGKVIILKVNIVSTVDEGGISTYSDYLSEALEENGDFLKVDRTENHLLESDPIFYSELADKTKDGIYDVAHVQHEFGLFGRFAGFSGIYAYLYYPLLSSDIAVVTTFHEVESLARLRDYGKLMEFVGTNARKFLSLPIFAFSDIVIVHNERAKNILEDIGFQNIEVIPHGVVQRETRKKDRAKEILGFDSNKKLVTLFGFVNEFKGHDRVVEQIDKLDDDAILYVAGKPSPVDGAQAYFRELEFKAEELGSDDQIFFHGFVDEDAFGDVFGASDLMIFPYRHITESGAMSLAFGYGRPILASDLPAFQDKPIEICENDNWAERINEIVHDEEKLEEMEANSEQYAEENSWKKVAERTIEVYKEVL